jgi:hypothetical protein
LLRGARWTVQAHVLAGASHVGPTTYPLTIPYEVPGFPPIRQFAVAPSNWVAGAIGGSLDYRLNDRLSFRLVQPDWMITASPQYSNTQFHNNLRISTGLVFRLGKR